GERACRDRAAYDVRLHDGEPAASDDRGRGAGADPERVVTALEDLAQWIFTLEPDRIPPKQHRLARMRLLDTFGLIAAALDHTAGKSLLAWAGANAGTGATVIGIDTPALPATAALVHGSLAHARDFDDTFIDSVIHPGSTVIATALATGEAADAPFE